MTGRAQVGESGKPKLRRARRERLGGTKTSLAERVWLRGFARHAMGDVSLDSWEVSFVATMALIAEDPSRRLPTEKQCRWIRALAYRLWYAPDDPAPLLPKPGFDWDRVEWLSPEDQVSDTCSYCSAPLYDDDRPLRQRRDDGWRAVFCDDCQGVWFGVVEPLPATAYER